MSNSKQSDDDTVPTVANPFRRDEKPNLRVPGQVDTAPGAYEETLNDAHALQERPFVSAGINNIQRQHLKGRMTIWERIRVLTDEELRGEVWALENGDKSAQPRRSSSPRF